MPSRVACEAEPTCGSSETLSSAIRSSPTCGFVFKDVEPGAGDDAALQRIRQGRLVHRRASADIDQHTVCTQRRQNLRIDRLCGAFGSRHDDDDRIDSLCHLLQGRVIGVGETFAWRARMIVNGNAETFQPPGDRKTDATQAIQADRAAAQRQGRQRKRTIPHPTTSPQPILRLRQLPDRIEQETDRRIGNFFGQNIRRVGNRDALVPGVNSIDAVIADPEIGDDLELLECIHESSGNLALHRDARNAGGKLRRDQRRIGSGDEDRFEMLRQAVENALVDLSGHKNTGAALWHGSLL